MYHIATLTTVFFLFVPLVFAQTTRYVATTGEDTTDCTDEVNPCATIAYTINQANAGDIIDIAAGEYTESFEIDKDLGLHGEEETTTIIQAHEEPGEADSRVITIDGSYTVEITDVTIRNGVGSGSFPDNSGGGIFNRNATLNLTSVTLSDNEALFGGGIYNRDSPSARLTNVTFNNNSADPSGGGMYNWNSSPTLTDVTFIGNLSGNNGGGMWNHNNSSPTLTNVTFIGNVADSEDPAGNEGGGMYNYDNCSPTLTNVVFEGNVAGRRGGGMMNRADSSPTLIDVTFMENTAREWGGGMYNDGSAPTLTNVTFSDNSAGSAGGGMSNYAFSSPTLTNVTVHGNTAGEWGGGIFNVTSSPTLINVTVSGNLSDDIGGGMFNFNSFPVLSNVTLSGNVASSEGGAMYNEEWSSPTLTNVIVWNNQANGSTTSTSASIYNLGGQTQPTFSYSLVANSGGSDDWNEDIGVDDGNNLDADPLFVDTPDPDDAPTIGGDLRLTEGSPAIDAGDPDTDPLIYPTDEDETPIDLDGNPRFFGKGEVIDMGAYEYQGTVADEASPTRSAEVLGVPRPNPVRGSASLTLRVVEAQDITVEVFDALGRRVQVLYDGVLSAGTNETLTFDVASLPSGVYVIRAVGEDVAETQHVTVIR